MHELPKAGVLAVTRWGEGGASHQRGLHPIYNPRRGDCGCNPVRALHNYPHPSEGFVEAARRGLCIIPHPGEGLWKQPGEGSAKFHTPARGLWKHPGEGSAQPGEGSACTVHGACHGRECLAAPDTGHGGPRDRAVVLQACHNPVGVLWRRNPARGTVPVQPGEGTARAARRGLCSNLQPGEGSVKQPGEGSAQPGEGSAS